MPEETYFPEYTVQPKAALTRIENDMYELERQVVAAEAELYQGVNERKSTAELAAEVDKLLILKERLVRKDVIRRMLLEIEAGKPPRSAEDAGHDYLEPGVE